MYQEIRQEVKGRKPQVFQMDSESAHIAKTVTIWLQDNKVKVSEWPLQSPHFRLRKNLWPEFKMVPEANLTQLHQFCQAERAKIQTRYCEKLVEKGPKHETDETTHIDLRSFQKVTNNCLNKFPFLVVLVLCTEMIQLSLVGFSLIYCLFYTVYVDTRVSNAHV